jgi:hypothetical protein
MLDLVVRVPAGSLGAATTLTVSSDPTDEAPLEFDLAGRIYSFGPSGTTFDPPILVTMPYTGTPGEAVVLWSQTAGPPWEFPAIVEDTGSELTVEVTHFSVGCPVAADADADGYDASVDCNDTDVTIHPGATEICGDGIDQDCSGADLSCTAVDLDADGYDDSVDCNDTDFTIYPGATEICGDGIDQDCSGADLSCTPIDADGDGYDASVDCNDNDPTIHPGATETPSDGIDSDCDGND